MGMLNTMNDMIFIMSLLVLFAPIIVGAIVAIVLVKIFKGKKANNDKDSGIKKYK